jgi:hypothetical protein
MESTTRLAHVWYDTNGTIVAVGYVPETAGYNIQVTPLANQEHKVLETHLSEEQLHTVHVTHCVDIEKCCLAELIRSVKPPMSA